MSCPPDSPRPPASPAGSAGAVVEGPSAPARADQVRRVVDVTIAGLALVLGSPLLGLIALLVRASGPGPVLFRSVRIGYQHRPFEMLKFRTMRVGSDDTIHRDFVTRMLRGEDPRSGGPLGLYKLEHDPRVTRVGAILRRTSLDELPQLVNVLRGEMALVGPRPALPWEVELYQPRHHRRFDVRPGITGLWQVQGRNRLTMTEALDLDLDYLSRRSLRLDLWILLATVPAALSGRGAR